LQEYKIVRNGLSFPLWLLLFGTIENSQECRYTSAHSAVQIGLTALDMVMEIVTEKLDVGDGSEHLLGMLEVAGKEH